MNLEFIVFIIYLICMVCIGVVFFFRDKDGSEKTYFLGNRMMGAWVAALSAGASDMSAWVLMGLPTAIYNKGLSEVWIAIGLGLGYAISWIVEAPRLRQFSIVAGDSITIPQYLTNRFRSKSYALQVICAIVFLVAYTIYAASSIKACGILFHKVIGIDTLSAMYLAAVIIVSYTFLGGFSAVCWTDFFQGMLMLGAMLLAPIFAAAMIDKVSPEQAALPEHFWSMTSSWKSIVSGLGWGLGYFGMPHIIIRFMSIKSQKDLKKSSVIGIIWTVIILVFAALIGIIGRTHLGFDHDIVEKELVFVNMVREIFPAIISGLLLSAVLAAAMSTADSQLLAASSAFTNDVYKPIIRKNESTGAELLWNGRLIVLVVAAVALIIATNPDAGSIMGLVSNAWGVFGAAFGPAIMLSLFWRRFNLAGCVTGIVVVALVDCLYLIFCSSTGIYELVPGFFAGLIAAIAVALATKAPSEELNKLFDDAIKYND